MLSNSFLFVAESFKEFAELLQEVELERSMMVRRPSHLFSACANVGQNQWARNVSMSMMVVGIEGLGMYNVVHGVET